MIQCMCTTKYISQHTMWNKYFKNSKFLGVENFYFSLVVNVEMRKIATEMCAIVVNRLLELELN